MRFYEFEPIKHVYPDELVDKGAAASKSLAKKTYSGAKGVLGLAGKGLAKAAGMMFKHFDPAMQDLYKDSDPEKSKQTSSEDSRKKFKTALGKSLNKEFLDQEDINNLKIGLNQNWFQDMKNPEFKTALEKLLNKETLTGKELVLLKRVHAKIF